MSKTLAWGTTSDWDNAQSENGVQHAGSDLSLKQNTAEMGSVSLSDTIDGGVVSSVSFTYNYSTPVVVPYISTQNGTQTVAPRIRNLSGSGCDIFMEEADDEPHSGETVFYIVAEAGVYDIDGVLFEVGRHTTSTVRTGSNTGNGFGDTVSLNQSFSSTPVVLHGLQTYNNSDFMVTQANSITTTDFLTSQEAMQTGTSSATEDIGYIAIETGTGTLNGTSFETGYANDGSNDGYENTVHTISFSQSFSSAPGIIVSGQEVAGGDGYTPTGIGTPTTTSHSVYAMEDQIGDTERGHADETFGWLAIDSSFANATTSGSLTTAKKGS